MSKETSYSIGKLTIYNPLKDVESVYDKVIAESISVAIGLAVSQNCNINQKDNMYNVNSVYSLKGLKFKCADELDKEYIIQGYFSFMFVGMSVSV